MFIVPIPFTKQTYHFFLANRKREKETHYILKSRAVATTSSKETDTSEVLPRTSTVHETTDILKSRLNKLDSSTENEMCHKQKSRLNTPKSFTENEMFHIPKSRSITPKSSSEKDTSNVLLSRSRTPQSSLFSPYCLINEQDTYFDSYDVFLQVQEMGCGLLFATTQQLFC
jgi:hypothetical protein